MNCPDGNCNESPIMFVRNKVNIQLANVLKSNIVMGNSRLKEPLYNSEIDILKVIDSVSSQSCIRVRNYQPDKKNKHLQFISLGPSYLESQLSRAVDDAVEKNQIPSNVAGYLREQIGLNKKRKKNQQQLNPQQAMMLQRRMRAESISKFSPLTIYG